jgi:hypothetical protein
MKALRRPRLIVGTVLLLAVLVSVLRMAPRLSKRRADDIERVAEARALESAIDAEPALRDSLAHTLAEFVALAPRLVAGRTHAEAAATVVAWLNGIASRSSLKVRRAESLPDSAPGPLETVSIHAEVEGDIAGITRFLAETERGLPMLTVGSMAVTALEPFGRLSSETLRLELTASGFYLVGER